VTQNAIQSTPVVLSRHTTANAGSISG